ncbi:uncharacterized protein LOC133205988 [Saccostrea echinata]|uniref:uncharacterized protein LOC133205988 n=1 Tax=Saccostrea echinata TaxID=191078 RepID=UPI002A8126F7|nr:uncharacterized protein LOC133205988 [Saccostrea echinata]
MKTRHITKLLHCSIILLFSVTHAAKTKQVITSGKSIIQSENYPNNYPGDEDRMWIFNQTVGIWTMTIQDFHLQESAQCQNDYLLIRKSQRETPVKLCGVRTSEYYISNGPYLSLEFHSDSWNHEKGFSIEVQHVMNEAQAKSIVSKRKGTEVKLVTHVEHEGLFIVLLGVLSLAALVFVAMLGCFIVGMMKRRHERVIQQNMINRLQAQSENHVVVGRRYSRKDSVKDHKRPDFMRSFSNQSTTGLLSYQSAGYPQTGDHV